MHTLLKKLKMYRPIFKDAPYTPIQTYISIMEFKYHQYLVRFIQNANDSILRLEDTTSMRIFETMLLDRSYMEYTALGGLEFINRLVLKGLQNDGTIQTKLDNALSDRIKLTFTYAQALIIKPIVIELELMLIRRTSASEDVEVLGRRLREVESLLTTLGPKNDSMAALLKRDVESVIALLKRDVESATKRLTVLEEMSGGMILLPGGGPPCPAHINTVAFIPGSSTSFHSLGTIFLDTQSFTPNHLGTPITIKMPSQYCTSTDYVIPYTGTLPLKSIMPIKHLKHCTIVSLVGFTDSADYSFLGEMPQLTHLYITSIVRRTATPSTEQGGGNNPILSNISWITKLPNLHSVNFFGCSRLVDITPLKELKNLKQLDLRFTGVKNTECITCPEITIVK
jgi:hypothetical protein